MSTNRIPLACGLLVAGVLLVLPAGAHGAAAADTSDAQAGLGGSRGQMAVGMLQALEVIDYQPPACVLGQEMFDDVPANDVYCPWIEELSRRGITVGCDSSNYCPGVPPARNQLAVFVVRAMEACPTLDPSDEMIRVGSVCVDKYEASVWDAPTGGNQLLTEAEIAAVCPVNGQDCKDKIFARSVAGVMPAAEISYFQAQQALANSGKRLITNAEWQMAVSGTPDSTGPGTSPCNTEAGASVWTTGTDPGCVSHWGAFDMDGNVREMTADWVPVGEGCPDWDDEGDFSSDDRMCLSGAEHPVGRPAVIGRGGRIDLDTLSGPFAISADNGPAFVSGILGFRGAR